MRNDTVIGLPNQRVRFKLPFSTQSKFVAVPGQLFNRECFDNVIKSIVNKIESEDANYAATSPTSC